MTFASRIALDTTPLVVVCSIVLVAVVAFCSWIAWKRSGYRQTIGLLELLRLAIVVVIALLINQPEQIIEERSDAKPSIVLLLDQSPSMSTRDARLEESEAAESRAAVAQALVDADVWDAIGEHARVVVETFGGESTGQGQTDLYRPLAEWTEDQRQPAAIVLVSDGDWTAGSPPVEAAAQLRLVGVPVFVTPLGSLEPMPDLAVRRLDAPALAVAGKPVQIPVTIDSTLPEPVQIEVVLEVPQGSDVRKSVLVQPMSQTSETVSWTPEAVGKYQLRLSLPTVAGDLRPDNNAASASVDVREQQLRVLIVESYPRWEYRYLRNALLRDPGVEVNTLLFHPDLDRVGGAGEDALSAFPERRDQLADYDVVFLGDVGVGPGQLTANQCDLLAGLVQQQASGLVFLPGRQGRQQSLLDTALADLYPVVLDPSQPRGVGMAESGRFQLTEAGRQSLLTKLAPTAEENHDVWQSLPGFQWVAPVVRARAGSKTLAVHATETNRFGRLPLIVTRSYGAGRVLLMATDGAWRWRMGVEDKYHYRFWGQVVRWMAYRRTMAEGETMRVYYAPDQPRVGRTLAINANVMSRTGEPLDRGEVVARIVAPSGRAETLGLRSTGEAWGAFAGQFLPRESGEHAVTIASRTTNDQLETSIAVRDAERETIGRPARPEVLAEIARVSGGAVVSPGEFSRLDELLGDRAARPTLVRRIQWWRRPETVFAVVLLLGLFWSGRKAAGLV